MKYYIATSLPRTTAHHVVTHLELGYSIVREKRVFLHSEEPLLFELGPQTNAFYFHPDTFLKELL